MDIQQLVSLQREYFKKGETLSLPFRLDALKKLYASIKNHENDILTALKKDLGKSDFEGYMCEIGMCLSEISYLIKNLKKFARVKKVPTHISQFKATSKIISSPYGNTLIMSPWNYPLLLTLEPLAAALAAGNTAIVKPSAYSPATSDVIELIVSECFEKQYVAVVTGGRAENSELLHMKFDFIFFTGCQAVGKEVLRCSAEHLTPAVLELGGKSPCIVDDSAKIPLAARRIVFGKYLNCGQTCVAPDYILCHKAVKEEFVTAVKAEIKRQFGEHPLENPDYGHIISSKHFERIRSLIDENKVVFGGNCDEEKLQIEPTVMDGVTLLDPVMQEEIFGPVMPIVEYSSKKELYQLLSDRQKPLALYIFSENKGDVKELCERLSFGGGCVNDTVMHLVSSHLPFGGVGESGMGRYHGKWGFDTFSHQKSLLDKSTKLDMPMRYQPYNRKKYEKTVKAFMK